MRHRFHLLAGFLIAVSCLAFGQQEQFKEWRFQSPAGWQLISQGEFALLTPPDATGNSDYIKLFPGQAFSGELQAWFESQVALNMQGMTVLKSNPTAPLQTIRGYPAFQKILAVQASNGLRLMRVYVGGSPSTGRGELLVFQSELAKAREYTGPFGEFVKTIDFSNHAGQQPTLVQSQPSVVADKQSIGSPHKGPLDGWYAGYHLQVFPGPNFTTFSKTVWDYYRFFPEGWVYTSFPKQLDLDAVRCPEAGIGNDKCQQYAVRGNTITIGHNSPDSFASDAEGLKMGGSRLWPLRPLRTAPVGTYESVGGAGILSTMALSVDNITFLPDGTFVTSGSTGVSSTSSTGGTTVTSTGYGTRGGSGRFRIDGYQLELTYNNGKVVREKMLAPSDDMDLLVIGDSNYLKKDRKR